MRPPGLVIVCLTVVLHATCNANPSQVESEAVNPARLAIKFQEVQVEPPQEISIKLSDDWVINITLDRPLSGGFIRYRVPAVTRQQLQHIVEVLTRRPDIENVESDQRRRID